MPFFSGGSVLNIMKFQHPQARARARDPAVANAALSTHGLSAAQGLEEPVIATIIDAVLKALSYFHRNGNIHRDIKARARVHAAAQPRVAQCTAALRRLATS